ncbi:MAG: ethanolamine utilization protein EutH [Clostridiales bacterium]|jgi:ethanolamine transporter|nr:ethanolamine utilization protein EutH [Clostridiales bacterium]
MGINQIIIYIMLIFMAAGVVDKLFLKNKFGFGDQFTEGIMAMGALALAMVGIMCFAPVLGKLLTPVVSPLYKLVGADAAMFAGFILAIDMGGYPLSQAMSVDPIIHNLSGIYMGAMMGATIVFSIPVSLGIIQEEDKPYLAKGMLAGFVSVPFGVLISGLVGGIPFGFLIVNLIPTIVLAALLAAGLYLIPNGMLKGFIVFSKGITILITVCLGVAIVETLGGFTIIPGMDPIGPQLETVGVIAITLAGAYPLVHFITKVFSKPLMSLGKLMGVNEVTAAGMIAALANNIPMFGMMKDMDKRGKILAVAFSVCASFAFGDHLGFTSAQNPDVIVPMIVGKVLGGVVGVVIAILLVCKNLDKDEKSVNIVKKPVLTK